MWPRTQDVVELRCYLATRGAIENALRALDRAFDEYSIANARCTRVQAGPAGMLVPTGSSRATGRIDRSPAWCRGCAAPRI